MTAISPLFDPGALTIVVTGTAFASAMRCGRQDFIAAIRAAGGLVRRGFDSDANRKALALALTAIHRDGSHRADPALPPDRALGLMLENYLRHGTIAALTAARRAERALDEARRISAVQVFTWAGELAPVFGLIGTLYGLTQLVPGDSAHAAATIMASVSTAVLTSLYGALLGHLVCYPLASAIERRGQANDHAREALTDWFIAQIETGTTPAHEPRARLRGVA